MSYIGQYALSQGKPMPNLDCSQQVYAAFTSLRKGLRPFVEQEMKAVHKDHWLEECERAGVRPNREGNYTWDVMALLKIITNVICWRDVFAMEKRRGAKERGVFVTLLEWRHEFKGHDDKDVPEQTAQEVIESVIYALRCIDAKDEIKVAEDLLLSLTPLPVPQPIEPKPQVSPSALQAEKTNQSKSDQPADFWDAKNFDFTDALNEEIWLLSPDVQQQIHPTENLKQPGAIGSQQAMLDSRLLTERGPLPWVPDLVGKESQDEGGIVIVGSAYAGFIHEYSTRAAKLPLQAYLAASSIEDFQRLFLSYVVRPDASYYIPLQNLCSDFGSASKLTLMDLCRVSLVKRGLEDEKRSDSNRNILGEAPAMFEKYVESEQPADWLWRRLVDGQAKCVLALGLTVEHGLLRLFSHRGMRITQGEFVFRPKSFAPGVWAMRYADPSRTLRYWLDHETWWTIRGQVNGVERVWYVLPTYHPSARSGVSDTGYERTKTILKAMQATI